MPAHAVIFHDMIQARAAAAAAAGGGVRLELRSPPGAASSLGPGVVQAIAEDVARRHPHLAAAVVLDCGGDAGLALAALRHGCRDICVDAAHKTRVKIVAIAQARSARVRRRTADALDLGLMHGGGEDKTMTAALHHYFKAEPGDAG